MPRVSKIQYNSKLSVAENAKKNGVSEAAIRYYIKVNDVDRNHQRKQNIIDTCKKYLKKNPNASQQELYRKTGYSVSTIRRYWEYITTKNELGGFNQDKLQRKIEKFRQILSNIPIDVIKAYIAEQEPQKVPKKDLVSVEELKLQIDELKDIERNNSSSLRCLPPPTLDDLERWEEYDASKYLCYAFRKKGDLRKGKELLDLGNMCGGYEFDLNGVHFKNSEAAYICGMFSDNTEEHISIQKDLIANDSGFDAKKFIRTPNENKARNDWHNFNVQWMLYVVWNKIQGNKVFRDMLMSIPDGAAIIEDSSFQKGETATFWGTKNNERKDFYMVFKRFINESEPQASKKEIDKRLLNEFNNFTDYGTFRGSNVMGKILMICRKCLADGTEPAIDFGLLKSKKIHINGRLIDFGI